MAEWVGGKRGDGQNWGALASMSAIDLGAAAAREALDRADLSPTHVDHVVMGNALQTSGDAIYGARHVGLKAGVSDECPALTVNRLCGSGLQSVINAAQMLLLSLTGDGPGGYSREHIRRTLGVSVAAGVVVGWFLVCVARIGGGAGLLPLVTARLVAIALFTIWFLVRRLPLVPPPAARGMALGAGAFDSAANVAYWFAVQGGSLALTSALVSLAPATTVMLARAFLGERWSAGQRFGLALALAAGVCISLG